MIYLTRVSRLSGVCFPPIVLKNSGLERPNTLARIRVEGFCLHRLLVAIITGSAPKLRNILLLGEGCFGRLAIGGLFQHNPPKAAIRTPRATIMAAERSTGMNTANQKQRRLETPDERDQRFAREAELKRTEAVANEAAIDRMIRRNIEQYGP